MKAYKLVLCYDGTKYSGWQKQANTQRTIQYKLEAALSAILGQEIELAGSGRTDAGVHARRQVCSFHCKAQLDCGEILARLRQSLPEDIGAISLEPAPARFHARLNCIEKTYVYRIWNSAEPNVFERKYMLRLAEPLDLGAMQRAADSLIGEHDFSAFCSNKRMKKSAVRKLRSIEISRLGDELRISLTANGFLYNMVRIIVGTLLEAGLGTRSIESVAAALRSCSRGNAGPTAPAHALILWDVKY